jgi:hypothetical protein
MVTPVLFSVQYGVDRVPPWLVLAAPALARQPGNPPAERRLTIKRQ